MKRNRVRPRLFSPDMSQLAGPSPGPAAVVRPRDDKDNFSVSSTASASHRIFEGFLYDGATLADADASETLARQPPPRVCASWNSRNDFIHVTSTKRPFRIYFDEIIAAKKVGPDRFQLIAYILRDDRRVKIIYEISFHDFANFERIFISSLCWNLPPNLPKMVESETESLFQRRLKVFVIANPFSGQRKALDLWAEHAQPIFEEAGIPYQLMTTTERGHASQIAHTIDLDEFGALVVVSGDGLVAEVIHGLLTRRADRDRALRLPILHIPGGTGNGLAASIAFQCNEPFAARGVFCREMALMLAGGQPCYRPLRLYDVEMADNVHMPMFMSMTWGLVADIDLGSERFRWAGLIRYHIEAFIRIARLPSVAHYRGRISYLPVTNQKLLLKTKLKATDDRRKFGNSHFDGEDVAVYSDPPSSRLRDFLTSAVGSGLASSSSSIEDAFSGTHLTHAPPLSEPVPPEWTIIDGEFVFVCLSAMSHLGSDLPYLPSTRLEEEIFYLTYVDWRTVKSRFHIAHLLITIDRGEHLDHPCFQVIPVLACRVEPATGAGGHVALDGEPCRQGAAFQVVSSSLRATVVARQPRGNDRVAPKKSRALCC